MFSCSLNIPNNCYSMGDGKHCPVNYADKHVDIDDVMTVDSGAYPYNIREFMKKKPKLNYEQA